MDLSEEKACEDLQSLAANIPVLSDYVKGLESHVKSRYLQKISVVGVDQASIPTDRLLVKRIWLYVKYKILYKFITIISL